MGPAPRRTSISQSVVRRQLFDPQQGTLTERVGKEWTARVVRAGRRPPDYEAAYEELEGMLESVGIAVDDHGVAGIVVRSIETNEGPGFELSASYRVEDELDREVDYEDRGEKQ